MIKNSFIEYLLELLSPLDNIKSKKMFGGYGIYKDNIFFALVSEEILYFKVDDSNIKDFQAYDSKPFSYENKNKKTISMSYFQVPVEILENQSELITFANKSINAAIKSKALSKLRPLILSSSKDEAGFE